MTGEDGDPANAVHCASLVRDGDFERYAATLFVKPDLRRALLALYAFNLEIARIREHISQPLAGEIRLQWWSDLLAGTAHGEAAGNPVAAELLRAIERHSLPRQPFERLIEAHRFDLYDEPMQTRAELENYLQGTASALFALGERVLDADAQPGDELLQHAGLALGLVRMAEALPRHASRGQLYLPLAELGEAGVAVEALFAGKSSPQLQRYLQDLAGEARQHLEQALGRLLVTDTPARKVYLPLALIERRLRQLTSPVYQPFAVQPAQSNLSVLWTLWRASRREPFRS
jgi:15-cis-phytoene synthase